MTKKSARLDVRQPLTFFAEIALSRYVREELLASDLLIEPAMLLKAHLALQQALRETAIPYLVRKQGGSGPRSLRGKETDCGIGRRIVFTDNSPAIWLHELLLRISRTGDGAMVDLTTSLANRGVPVAAAFTRDESGRSPEWPLLRRCVAQAPAVWAAGWKLSHILPCSPQGPHSALAKLDTHDPAEYFRVRFLRNLSPFNYFLTPRPKLYEMYLDATRPVGADLGEDSRVIAWVVRVLREEVFANYPDVREAFDLFLQDAGCGDEVSKASDGLVRVTPKTRDQAEPVARDPILKPVVSPIAASDASDYRVFQINQGVSGETYAGLLCAPDRNTAGWPLLKKMKPGDVILHNVNAKIRAISVVEPMNPDDERLVSRATRIRRVRRRTVGCLEYDGEHLSIDERPEKGFLTCLVTTVVTDLALPYARRTYGGYAVELGPTDLENRADLASGIQKARMTGLAMEEEEPEAR